MNMHLHFGNRLAIRKIPLVVTTPSQTADKLLRDAKKAQYTVHDEISQATDATSLMIWFNNVETVVRHIMVGDPRQLGPVVKSAGRRPQQGEVGNPFSDQLQLSWMNRLQDHGFEFVLLREQFRQAAGLSDIINKIFYKGEIVDGKGTELANRPKAVEAIQFIKDNYQKNDNIPHICLSVPDGVCTTTNKGTARYNFHSIAATIKIIRKMMKAKLWTQEQILVMSPYKRQCTEYRKALG